MQNVMPYGLQRPSPRLFVCLGRTNYNFECYRTVDSAVAHSDPRIGHAMRVQSSAAPQRTCCSFAKDPKDPGVRHGFASDNSRWIGLMWILLEFISYARSSKISTLKEIIRQTIMEEGLPYLHIPKIFYTSTSHLI